MDAATHAWRKGMVVTVGTGTRPDSDIAAPLIKSIREANPDAVVLITTAESASVAAAIQERYGAPAPVWLEERLPSADEIESAFRGCLAAIRRLLAHGLKAEAITADYTSGTKTMTAALVMAAVALRCGTLRYISGTREHGVVAAGTERFLATPPAAILAVAELARAEELLRRFQFQTAERLCREVNTHLLDPPDRDRRAALEQLARAYAYWDRFAHRQAAEQFKGLRHAAGVSAFAVPPQLPDRLRRLAHAIETGTFEPDLLADLVANAARRLLEGRWDDAVARLYRVTEMLAQWVLQQRYQYRTSAPDPARLPERVRAVFPDQQPLGLKRAYELLAALEEPLAARFTDKASGVERLLSARNESILAHGTRPVTEQEAWKFYKALLALARSEIADFEQRVRALQFPWVETDVLPV